MVTTKQLKWIYLTLGFLLLLALMVGYENSWFYRFEAAVLGGLVFTSTENHSKTDYHWFAAIFVGVNLAMLINGMWHVTPAWIHLGISGVCAMVLMLAFVQKLGK
ncbi:hypothetical protein JK159_00960 [Weissella minor]|uniref:hypothetical protein n=1 Tax=Weissella minor TaxID=1620 RepID=UPI001BAED05C|nr:hypothetical protein [Weissella minor]MBS0948953.1 hypothetical protein [Weissella minor]